MITVLFFAITGAIIMVFSIINIYRKIRKNGKQPDSYPEIRKSERSSTDNFRNGGIYPFIN